jgi:hypothetical protein
MEITISSYTNHLIQLLLYCADVPGGWIPRDTRRVFTWVSGSTQFPQSSQEEIDEQVATIEKYPLATHWTWVRPGDAKTTPREGAQVEMRYGGPHPSPKAVRRTSSTSQRAVRQSPAPTQRDSYTSRRAGSDLPRSASVPVVQGKNKRKRSPESVGGSSSTRFVPGSTQRVSESQQMSNLVGMCSKRVPTAVTRLDPAIPPRTVVVPNMHHVVIGPFLPSDRFIQAYLSQWE